MSENTPIKMRWLSGRFHGGHCKVTIAMTALLFFFSLWAGGVFAVQTNESAGPGSTGGAGGYGWQQAYNGAGLTYARLTGTADRQFYDYGYKPIELYSRLENYWSSDCGWWYVTGGTTLNITLIDPDGVVNSTLPSTSLASKGRTYVTYDWNDFTDPDPGRWTVKIDDGGNNTVVYYLYVRGQLNPSISTSGSTAGSPVTISVSLNDHNANTVNGSYQDNVGNAAAPTLDAYVSGAGESFTVSLTDPDSDGVWTGSFTPQNGGDHKITVKASDGHQYWVDGRKSKIASIQGTFPSASLVLSAVLRMFGGVAEGVSGGSVAAGLAGMLGLAAYKRRSGQ